METQQTDTDSTDVFKSPMLEAKSMEDSLPIFMLWSAMDVAERKYDFGFREDVMSAVKQAVALPFCRLDQLSGKHILERCESLTPTLINGMGSQGGITEVLLATSQFILKLVDEGLYPDPQDQAVLTALALVSDSEEGGDDWAGTNGHVAQAQAGTILDRCRLMGLFIKTKH